MTAKPAPDLPRRTRWSVLREIERLDPERDHQRIVHLSFGYEFPWDSIRALEIALYRTYCSPSISRLLDRMCDGNIGLVSNLALFDFDGTITWSDTWTPFMRTTIRPWRMAVGRIVLSPVVAGYRLGVVSASKGRCAAARLAFAGEDAIEIRRRGADYAARVLPQKLRPAALERLEWHRSRGDDVVVVSGSLDVYLEPWCAARELQCICTTLEERDGRFTGRYVGGDCSGAEKVRRVVERYDLSRYQLVYAYGDSGEDRELLELAHRKSYRWTDISSWDEVTSFEHPPAQ